MFCDKYSFSSLLPFESVLEVAWESQEHSIESVFEERLGSVTWESQDIASRVVEAIWESQDW